MSWDAHLTKLNTALPKARNYLFGLDNGAQWAGVNKDVTNVQIKIILAAFTDPAAVRAQGPTLSDVKYMITTTTEDVIIGKKGTKGFIAAKSFKGCVLTTFDEADCTPAQANIATQNFRDYLKGIKF